MIIMLTIPLFPMNTVLFPGGMLPLKIFEARYLDMVSECLRSGQQFGVCLISSGKEVGGYAECYEIGTLAKIVDWDRRDDGLLEIVVEGGQRFRLLEQRERANHLAEGDVQLIDDDDCEELPVQYQLLSDLLRQIAEKFELSYQLDHERFEDAVWVGYRLSEVLPLESEERQALLEINNPVNRLQHIQDAIEDVTIEETPPG
ncbi:MAG: LON peptidase substrate-binding domain-containing protein [Proteobacteria bacterium]|nr:LON peptidase substrate-binding domain-containing protein [Pseudomonadota bacterium]